MRLIRQRPCSFRLMSLLREAHDDGQPALIVLHCHPILIALRSDCSELSSTEAREIRALLAADAAEEIV
jgi:hypothetical protein